MSRHHSFQRARTVAKILAGGVGLMAAAYLTCAGLAWYRYGRRVARPADPEDVDELLDRFIPVYEVVERHQITVNAPASTTLAAARDQDLFGSPLVRAIFRARELVLGASADERLRPRALLADMLSLGWGVLAELPDREVVVGAVTRPWEANVVFHALSPERFAAFAEPGWVKIVWSLRADPLGDGRSIYRTETRAVATDPVSRARFRRYWSFASPGITTIRRLLLGPLKREAERRARARG